MSGTVVDSTAVTVAVDSTGSPIVAWREWVDDLDQEIYVRRWSQGSWQDLGSGSAAAGGVSNTACRSASPVLASRGGTIGLAWLDMSTGEFLTEPIVNGGLGPALARIEPGELLLADALFGDDQFRERLQDWDERLSPLPDRDFASEAGERRLQQSFDVKALDGFGQFSRAELGACGALINYVELTQKGKLPRIAQPRRQPSGTVMEIDAATRRNLELT